MITFLTKSGEEPGQHIDVLKTNKQKKPHMLKEEQGPQKCIVYPLVHRHITISFATGH